MNRITIIEYRAKRDENTVDALRALIDTGLELRSKGYSNRHIARKMNLSESTINRLLKRG